MSREEELLEKGFRLAYFIIPDRAAAIQILSDARSKLGSRRSREKKRVYWRDKHLKGKITRIAREDDDLLQWLIYFESEGYERQHEQFTQPLMEDMVVRYVKHLIQMTTSMSCFYVNIGLYRLLHDYSTAEVRRAYEWVSEHFAGDEEYRAVKGALINRLQERFEKFLSTCRTQRGEVRFETLEQQADWQDLVEECLRVFTPWSTTSSCWVPANFEPNAWTASKLLRKVLRSRDLDRIEMYRCHAFIDPCCYSHLTKGMGLDAPRDRLSVPKFFLKNEKPERENAGKSSSFGNPSSFGNRRPNPPDLTEPERGTVAARLEAETIQRQRALPQVLYIVAHGRECVRWNLARESKQRFEIQDGTKLIEIWTECQGERVLLATHLVRYTRSEGIADSKHVVDLDARRELLLHIIPAKDGAAVHLECKPAWHLFARKAVLNFSSTPSGTLAKYALASACLILIGWGLGTVWHNKDLARQRAATERVIGELFQERAVRAGLQHQLENGQGASSVVSFMLISGAASVRGQQLAQEPVVTVSPNTHLIGLKLPVGPGQQPSYSAVLKPFLEEREILKENFLEATTKTDSSEVTLLVPTSLLESGKRYVVTLYRIDKSGRQERVDLFTFYVVKK